ncbi:type II secretion system protein [Sporosarcina gallistercoris]|uniref:PulJ/GspJ family protein n=1 Tax=Sporosarcina gallistercoris TaxID=2762245 RepID=UPI003D268DDD
MIKCKTTEESGLTLVEILASLVILGIVFVAFMTIFPQMTLFNNRTETKLETMNEARVVLEEYRKVKWKIADLSDNRFISDGDWWTERRDSKTVTIIKIKKTPDEGPKLGETLKSGVVRLHRIQVYVLKNDRIISESFGYIQVK